MAINTQPRKKLNTRTALRSGIAGLLGAVVGRFAAGPLLSMFEDSPEWLAPVVVIGVAAVFMLAVLLFPLAMRSNRGNKT